ncbi:MAG TPA: hypothetical protein ENJ33_04975 [Thiothrix sp.]|nr:hypothetical protein [Thiothrix sp.]
MANNPLQAKLESIKQKRALYVRRVEDARQRSRADIERIWLNEIKVLDEQYRQLRAQHAGEAQGSRQTYQPSAQKQRKLMQLEHQIQYVEKKIGIHKSRGEAQAAQEQVVLLHQLRQQRANVMGASAQAQQGGVSSLVSTQSPSRQNGQVVNQAKLNAINADIIHADRMINEYQKYKSPKAQQWIDRKNQLVTQRNKLIGVGGGQKNTNMRPSASDIATAQAVNKDVRVLDLEIAHAEKMIDEYKKYNSPKANQWIDRKQELLTRRAQRTGKPISNGVNLTEEAITKRLRLIALEVRHADKVIAEYQKYNSPKQHEWIAKRKSLLAEKVQLEEESQSLNVPQAQPIVSNNNANTNNVTSLSSANSNASDANALASALEKSIADKYYNDKYYSHEHAYREIIESLVSQAKYGDLTEAKETLYDVTNTAKLPPKGTIIDAPFIRDCFKIKVSHVRLEGYTINDAIFDTDFPADFDKMIDRINPHVGYAPKLKYYKYLAHRDAIQLIPVDRSISRHNSQFAAAKLENITIKDVTIRSKGSLQGLFASDGAFEGIHMQNISIQTNSEHQIAILGLLSGTLDVSNKAGEPIHVNLLPLRLAGGNNIYITHFSSSSSYQYEAIDTKNSDVVLTDNRQKMTKRGTYYTHFDIDDFFAAMGRADPATNIHVRIKAAAEQAGMVAKIIT